MRGGMCGKSRRGRRFFSAALGLLLAACQGGEPAEGSGPASVRVVINEIYASGSDPLSDPDWVELKNLGEGSADLAGYRLRDDKTPFLLPAGAVVPARGYLMIYCDDAPAGAASDRLHAPFKLGGTDELVLLAPDGSTLDGIGWIPSMTSTGRTWGRLPDGTGQYLSLTPTPAARNL